MIFLVLDPFFPTSFCKTNHRIVMDQARWIVFGSGISGTFLVNAQVSSDVVRVEFYLNGGLQANDTHAPFNWILETINFPLGNTI